MRITCVGDCGKDRYLNLELTRLGGCTLNVAMNLRPLIADQDELTVVTCLSSDDQDSKLLEAELASREIIAQASFLAGNLPTQNIRLSDTGERQFCGYDQGVLSRWVLSKEQEQIISDADVVVAVVYSQIAALFDRFIDLPKRGLLAVDFMDMQDFSKDIGPILRYLPACDFAFFGLTQSSDQTLIASLRDWYSSAANTRDGLAIITLGAEGSMVVGREGCHHCPAVQVPQVVDTTGAGDSFLAAFMAATLAGKTAAESLEQASRHAAVIVQKMGGF